MNVGKAITAACQEQRAKDILRIAKWDYRYYSIVLAYWWWGWDISGRGGLGKPGSER